MSVEVYVVVSDTLLLATLAVGAVWDVRSRRIPNALVAAGLLAALALHALRGGQAFLASAAAAGAALILGFSLFATGIIGAGDAKLLTTAAAFLGLRSLPALVAFAALAGGVLALASAARRGMLRRVLGDAGRILANVVTMGLVPAPARPETGDRLTLPYAVAIAMGAVAARWL